MRKGLIFNNGKLLRNVLNTASNQSKTLRHTSLETSLHYYLYLLLKNTVILVTWVQAQMCDLRPAMLSHGRHIVSLSAQWG